MFWCLLGVFCDSSQAMWPRRWPTTWNRVLDKLKGSQLVKKIPRMLRKPKVHYSFHKSPQAVAVLSQLNLVCTFISCFLILISIIYGHLRVRLPSGRLRRWRFKVPKYYNFLFILRFQLWYGSFRITDWTCKRPLQGNERSCTHNAYATDWNFVSASYCLHPFFHSHVSA